MRGVPGLRSPRGSAIDARDTAEDSTVIDRETRPVGDEPVGEAQDTRPAHDVLVGHREPARSLDQPPVVLDQPEVWQDEAVVLDQPEVWQDEEAVELDQPALWLNEEAVVLDQPALWLDEEAR